MAGLCGGRSSKLSVKPKLAQRTKHSGRGYGFLTQMGDEGSSWIGIRPLIERQRTL